MKTGALTGQPKRRPEELDRGSVFVDVCHPSYLG
jgi:hypothetical protein